MSQPTGRIAGPRFTPSMKGGLQAILELLLQAYDCARDANADRWSFAIEIHALPDERVTNTILRWLVSKGYLGHRAETTRLGDDTRSFAPITPLVFSDASCFVLTDHGATHARQHLNSLLNGRAGASNSNGHPAAGGICIKCGWQLPPEPVAVPSNAAGPEHQILPATPWWDPDRKELSFQGKLVKRYRLPSPNQETVLVVFQEEGWPTRIDDPLPPALNKSSKARLHDTIKNLNRHQKHRLIRFCGDGTGEGIRWESMTTGDHASVKSIP